MSNPHREAGIDVGAAGRLVAAVKALAAGTVVPSADGAAVVLEGLGRCNR